MSRAARGAALLGSALVALAGCVIQPGPGEGLVPGRRFTYLSTEPGPLAGYPLEDARVVPDIEVVLETRVYFWVPSRVRPPTLEEAVAEALRRGGGNVLVDAEVDRYGWYFPPFYGREGWRVRGDVLRVEPPEEPAIEPADEASRGPGDVPPAER